MNTLSRHLRIALLAFAIGAALPAFAQQAYPTPDAAGDAFVDALGTGKADASKLATVLGAKWQDYVPVSGVERADVDAFLAMANTKRAYAADKSGNMRMTVGNDGWVLPIPLVKSGGGWHFDLAAGEDEMRTRRIGHNELDVEQAVRAYADAQMDYAEVDHDGDGVLEYAQKFVSTDGKHDGLFWADDDSGMISPLGPLFGDETPSGTYHGYRYRILDQQGVSAPGGKYGYMLGDDMSRGFALVAWPAEYGNTGIMTFMISHDGQVFERNLGDKTDTLARAMTAFDPDSGWKEVKPTDVAGR